MRTALPALLMLLLVGCWDQFDAGLPTLDDDDSAAVDDDDTSIFDDDDTSVVDDDDTTPVVDDDDTSVVDDDDSSVLDDDDSSALDDDDSSALDDDDSSALDDDDSSALDDDDVTPIDPCDEPEDIQVSVSITDPSGAPSTEFTTTSPLTVTVDIQNFGGGNPTYIYPSACLFRWDLWYQNGIPVDGGPDCVIVQTYRDYDCDGAPHTDNDEVYPIEFPSGVELVPGDYTLDIESYYFGLQTFTITVP
jgi:hypothetical protein